MVGTPGLYMRAIFIAMLVDGLAAALALAHEPAPPTRFDEYRTRANHALVRGHVRDVQRVLLRPGVDSRIAVEHFSVLVETIAWSTESLAARLEAARGHVIELVNRPADNEDVRPPFGATLLDDHLWIVVRAIDGDHPLDVIAVERTDAGEAPVPPADAIGASRADDRMLVRAFVRRTEPYRMELGITDSAAREKLSLFVAEVVRNRAPGDVLASVVRESAIDVLDGMVSSGRKRSLGTIVPEQWYWMLLEGPGWESHPTVAGSWEVAPLGTENWVAPEPLAARVGSGPLALVLGQVQATRPFEFRNGEERTVLGEVLEIAVVRSRFGAQTPDKLRYSAGARVEIVDGLWRYRRESKRGEASLGSVHWFLISTAGIEAFPGVVDSARFETPH